MELGKKFSVFVLVICLCLHVEAIFEPALQRAGPDGKIVLCKTIPEDLKKSCVTYTCDDAAGSVSALPCGLVEVRCKAGEFARATPEDLTKKYPDCCPQAICVPE